MYPKMYNNTCRSNTNTILTKYSTFGYNYEYIVVYEAVS